MVLERSGDLFALRKEGAVIGRCETRSTAQGAEIRGLCISAQWRRKGYGSYFLKEVLRAFGGYDTARTTVFTAPLPSEAGARAFWAKFGFAEEGGLLVRRFVPDLTAVRFVQDYLRAHLVSPRLCIDATCGNGGDTAFLCGLSAEGHVLGFDVQPQAIASTRARLGKAGIDPVRYTLVLDSHENLLRYAAPGTADAVMFNFGWLPGADHAVYSRAQSSIPALEAALKVLRPGGILSSILYSGQVIGTDEKQAALAWMRALPLKECTVLVCNFANWDETAPLPCLLLKK